MKWFRRLRQHLFPAPPASETNWEERAKHLEAEREKAKQYLKSKNITQPKGDRNGC